MRAPPGETASLESKAEVDVEPVLIGRHTYTSITQKLVDLVIARPVTPVWLLSMGGACLVSGYLAAALIYLVAIGVGIWGINIPVAWGFAIINYVWWIEIAMGGTFTSTALYLAHQRSRTTINRYAECMMLSAWCLAALYPVFHLGRPYFLYWLLPYPNTMDLYPQLHSALIWDVVALNTYLGISVLFFYTGLIPDFASIRDRAREKWKQTIFGILALGWKGSAREWAAHKKAYTILAGCSLTIVFTVHSVVGLDFATTLLPGWQDPWFPPYFIAEAILSGLTMALVLGVPIRGIFALDQLITTRHLDLLARLALVMSLILVYTYSVEAFMAFYSGDPHEIHMMAYHATGRYGCLYWISIVTLCVLPQLFWLRTVRTSGTALFLISFIAQIGMWIERYWTVVDSTSHSYLPGMRRPYTPTFWDWSTFAGTFGLFAFIFMIFLRTVPMVSIAETRDLLHATGQLADPREKGESSE